VYNAQGNYLIQVQTARLAAEQVKQARIDTQRRLFEEWMYMRDRMPKPEDLRQADIKLALNRSLNDPPLNEVASGQALNSILNAIEKITVKKDVPAVPINDELLRNVNVTKAGAAGNLGLLKDEGKLTWPRGIDALAPAEEIAEAKKTIDARAKEAYRQATTGRVDPELLKDMEKLSKQINDRLSASVGSMGFSEYSDAKRFLKNLDDAIAVMQQPDAGDLLPGGRNAAKGKSAQELVKHMTDRGLRFAPSVGGDSSYLMLHRALVQYYNAISGQGN
jgi:hypothetical protein